MNAWRKLPLIVRAVIVGSLINLIGHLPPGNFYLANVTLSPSLPWSLLAVIVYLWFFWQWVEGRWWPASTSEWRRENLRGGPLTPQVWRWSLIAGGLWMSSVGALHFVLARFELPRFEGFYRLFALNIHPLILAVVLLEASAVAGIVEEAAFRGYMQTPIERRYGPAVAIIIVGVVFVLFHFADTNVPMSITRVFFIFAAAVNYGMLTHLTGSIRPGIVLHATGDAAGVGLLWWIWMLAGPVRSSRPLGFAAAHDPLFWLYCAEALVLGAAAVWAFLKLARTCGQPIVISRRPRMSGAAAGASHP